VWRDLVLKEDADMLLTPGPEMMGISETAAIIEDAKAETAGRRRWFPGWSVPLDRNDLVRKADLGGVWLVVVRWEMAGVKTYPTYQLHYYRERRELLEDRADDVATRKWFVGKKIAADILWPEEKGIPIIKNPCSEVDLGPNYQEKERVRTEKGLAWLEKLAKAKEAILAGLHSWPETWRPVRGSPPNVKGLEDIPLDDVYAGKTDDWIFPIEGIGIFGQEMREYHERCLGIVKNPCLEVDPLLAAPDPRVAQERHRRPITPQPKCPHCGGSGKIVDCGDTWPCACTFRKTEKPLEGRTLGDSEIATLAIGVWESKLPNHVTKLDGSVGLRRSVSPTSEDVMGQTVSRFKQSLIIVLDKQGKQEGKPR
jgi:hypothetical protein